MRQSRIYVELNDTAFRHLKKAEVVLTFKNLTREDGTKTHVIPISKRSMKYKAQYYFDLTKDKT